MVRHSWPHKWGPPGMLKARRSQRALKAAIAATLIPLLTFGTGIPTGDATPSAASAAALTPRTWSRVLGSGQEVQVAAVDRHPDGGVVVVASTDSSDLVPAGGNPYDRTYGGVEDAWVAHYSDDGTLIWATYLGGAHGDFGLSVDVTDSGIFVGGVTRSPDFVTGASTSTAPSVGDPFVAYLSLDGTSRRWAWVAEGAGGGGGRVAATPDGGVVLAGGASAAITVTPGVADPNRVADESLVARLDADGNLLWMTYLGGSGNDDARAVAIRSDGSIVVAGATSSVDFPVTPGAFDTTAVPYGDITGFVTVLSGDGSTIEWSSYFQSTTNTAAGETVPSDVEVDDSDGIYVSGNSERLDLPVHQSAVATVPSASGSTGFIAHFTPSGATVDKATYLPGLRYVAMAKGAPGSLLVGGRAEAGFVATDGAITNNPGSAVVEIDSGLSHVSHSAVLGGGNQYVNGVTAVDGGAIFVGTIMGASGFPGGYPSPAWSGTVVRVALRDPYTHSISFPPLTDRMLGETPFSIAATTTSGLPVRLVSETPSVCTVANSTVTVVNKGDCTLRASQPTESSFYAAADVTRTFSVISLPPTITSFSPTTSGARLPVTITGTNLLSTTLVKFNGKPARSFTVVSANEVIATAPAGATTGKITVTTRAGTATSVANVVMVASPTMTTFTPQTGGAGAVVMINGTGFNTAATVSFNGTPAAFRVVSTTLIAAVVPPGASSGQVSVTTAGGTAKRSKFRFIPAPTITSVTRVGGNAGSSARISGTNLTNATSVLVDGVAASFKVLSSKLIKVTVPAGAAVDQFTVTTPGGQVSTPRRWRTVTAGYEHSCAVRSDRTLWCWGGNFFGQLGIGTIDPTNVPAQVSPTSQWLSASAGTYHTCAIRSDKSLWCWGRNTWGQLGEGTTQSSTVPVRVGQGANWATVSTSGYHTCGIRDDQTLWCWGSNQAGQLGVGNDIDSATPLQVGQNANWMTVSAGYSHTCATQSNGTLWCWGNNNYGELGNGTTTLSPVPVRVGQATNWSSVTAGGSEFTCGIRTDRSLWCWGSNLVLQLGTGPGPHLSQPEQVGNTSNWSTVAAGGDHACGTRIDGTIWCWGENFYGALGNGTTTNNGIPGQVGDRTDWVATDGGNTHQCATRSDGTLWCWGYSRDGQLGDGTVPSLPFVRTLPVAVAT